MFFHLYVNQLLRTDTAMCKKELLFVFKLTLRSRMSKFTKNRDLRACLPDRLLRTEITLRKMEVFDRNVTNFFDKFIDTFFYRFFYDFLNNFLRVFWHIFLTYNLFNIASFWIKVPSIFFSFLILFHKNGRTLYRWYPII